MNSIKDFVRSKRDGDFFSSHENFGTPTSNLLGCDALDYLSYRSLILSSLKRAKITHPELYDALVKRNFVVKRKPGPFNAVSPDLALEQTIQRSAKMSYGLIGKT